MTATPIALAAKDNAQGLLNATVQAADLSIPLASGKGALFPQPYSGTATSLGTSTTLNSTGILAAVGGSGSAMAGKIIWNKTDGSIAVIVSVATNSLTCTRLVGGTANTWSNSDRWCIDPFVLTLGVLNTSVYGVQSDGNLEEVLVIGRATDTLSVASDGRGYNGTTARQFTSGDYAYLRVTSPLVERLKDILSVIAQKLDTYQTSNDASLVALLNNSSLYAVDTGSANAYAASFPNITGPIAAGMLFFVKASFANTASATLTVTLGGSAQSAKTIKKEGGATNLAANNVPSGGIMVLQYDGTNFQLLNPIANAPVATVLLKYTNSADSNDISTDAVAADWNTNYTIPANDLVAGVEYEIEASGTYNGGTTQRRLNIGFALGSTVFFTFNPWVTPASTTLGFTAKCRFICRSTGGSGTVMPSGKLDVQAVTATNPLAATDVLHQIIQPTSTTTIDTTASGVLKLTSFWNVNDGSGKSSILKDVRITRFG